MNGEEIIRMAREAGLDPDLWNYTDAFERFAALVAAAEREKVAAWMMARGYATGHGDTIEDLLVELEWQVRESEREACAKVCEDIDTEYEGQDVLATWCAAAIRARGQA
jgi:hypothetical protein